jgi:hypothetical protein
MKRSRIARTPEVTKQPCGCCGSVAILTLRATAPDGGELPHTTKITLCAECIISFAQALADQR